MTLHVEYTFVMTNNLEYSRKIPSYKTFMLKSSVLLGKLFVIVNNLASRPYNNGY